MTSKRSKQEDLIDARLRHINSLPLLAALDREVQLEINRLYLLRKASQGQRESHDLRLLLKQEYLLQTRIRVISPIFVEQALRDQAYQNLPEHERTDKVRYRYLCSFRLDAATLSKIRGYDLLVKYGWYNHKTNPGGVVRDHRFSIKAGWELKIDPEIMSHPANCEFLINADNIRKSDNCSVTLCELELHIGA